LTATREVLTPRTIAGLIPEPVGEIEHTSRINALIYGEPGDGKTHLSGSADEVPEWRKVLQLDVEGGSMTLRRKFPRVETVRVTSWSKLWDIGHDLFMNDCYDFGTVIIDNLTEAQNLCKRKVMEDAKERAKDPDDIELEVPRQRDWGVLAERTMLLVRNYRDLPVNFIATAHVMEVSDNRGKKKLKPALQGSAKHNLPAAFDLVFYLRKAKIDGQDEEVRLLSTSGTSEYIAKERDTNIPKQLGNPTMAEILSYIPKG